MVPAATLTSRVRLSFLFLIAGLCLLMLRRNWIKPKTFDKSTQYSQNGVSMTEVEVDMHNDPKDHDYFTVRGYKRLIFYTRVHKTGGTTGMWLFGNFSQKSHQFDYFRSAAFGHETCSQKLCNYTTDQLIKLAGINDKPVLFDKHSRFVDFSEYGKPMPMYISVVRNPVDQFRSRYYFRRYTYEFVDGVEKNISLDDCVSQRMPECLNYHPTLEYLCGMSPVCEKASSRKTISGFCSNNLINDNFCF